MKGGAQTALALGVGYILGRRRKMRLATMLALGAATGGAAKLGPAALRQGTKYLGKTDIAGALGPQVTEIVNTVRGELLDAAKGAAAAAVTSRVDSLSDNLHERAETLRNPEAAVGKVGETAGETVGRAAGLGLFDRYLDRLQSGEGAPPALLVTGLAGMGQTHLLREMKVRAQTKDLESAVGRDKQTKQSPKARIRIVTGDLLNPCDDAHHPESDNDDERRHQTLVKKAIVFVAE